MITHNPMSIMPITRKQQDHRTGYKGDNEQIQASRSDDVTLIFALDFVAQPKSDLQIEFEA